MQLSDFFSPDAISLALPAASKDEALGQLVDLLRLPL